MFNFRNPERHDVGVDVGIKERLKSQNFDLRVYLLRHAETTKDKLDPNRGLTEEGKEQCRTAAQRIISELNPKDVVLNLLYSGMPRANQTLDFIVEELKQAGFEFYEPERLNNRGDGIKTKGVPRTEARRLSGIRNVGLGDDNYRKELYSAEKKASLGLPSDIGPEMVWLNDLNRPKEVETPEQVSVRVKDSFERAQRGVDRFAPSWREKGKKVVTLALTHGAVMEKFFSNEMDVDVNKLGVTPNVEGYRIDFSEGNKPVINPWGEKIEKTVKDLKKDLE